MVVNKQGEMHGSIGGGIMEYKFIKLAKERMKKNTTDSLVIRQVHDKLASEQSGMICSGEQTILLCSIKQNDTRVVQNIISCITTNSKGNLMLSGKGIAFDSSGAFKKTTYELSDSNEWFYAEPLKSSHNLYIIGGGHCALCFAAVMSTMDYFITIIDDRPDLHLVNYRDVTYKSIFLREFEKISESIPSDENTYVVIMTFGYRSDDIALRAVMNRSFRYLGVLGSKTKIRKMFEEYRKEGIPDLILNKIHAPVGIMINSQTPEEIAISIAAEIIRVRRESL